MASGSGRRGLAAVALGLLVIGAYRAAMHSSFFAIAEIVVRGSSHVPADEVRNTLPFGRGDNVLRADTTSAATRLHTHPWIATARVYRQLPNQIIVEITERTAVAVLRAGGDYLLDARGTAFKAVDGMDDISALPIVSGLSRGAAATAADHIATALRMGRTWEDASLGALRDIVIDEAGGATLVTVTGAVIALGAVDNATLAARMQAYTRALTALKPDELIRIAHVHFGQASERIVIALARNPDGQDQEQ